MGTEILSRGYSGRRVKLTTYFHITSRLSTSGAIPHICSHNAERKTSAFTVFCHLFTFLLQKTIIISRYEVSMYDPIRRQVKQILLNGSFLKTRIYL